MSNMGTAKVALTVAAAVVVIYAILALVFYVGPRVILDAILGNSESVTFKICLFFGAYKIVWQFLTIMYLAFQHLFVWSLSSALEKALGYKRLHARYARAGPNLPADQKSWAMVTGASDGIGLAMCKVLAE